MYKALLFKIGRHICKESMPLSKRVETWVEGGCSTMGKMESFWVQCMRICFQLNAPPNDLITECTATLAPEFHSFYLRIQ